MSEERNLTLSQNARLLALVSLAMADAAIGCWDAKFHYLFWRPVTAIKAVAPDDDGDPATVEDTTWAPLFATPNHPEYPSGHSCVSGAAGRVLSRYFGDETPFSLISNATTGPTVGQVRTFTSFSEALEEVKNARIYAGIHFRTACDVGQALGIDVADHVLETALVPVHGARVGQLRR